MEDKKLILIVDDNKENQKLLGNILNNLNYEVGIASDGFKAIDFVKKENPDLILLDIMMPGIDGFEVCKRLKSDVSTRHIPIIFLTAKTNTKDIVKGFKLGGVDYILKPFNKEELAARVNTHIELRILRGFLPICSECKNIRDSEGYWHSIEKYMRNHSDVTFTHSLCKKCLKKLYGNEDWFKEK